MLINLALQITVQRNRLFRPAENLCWSIWPSELSELCRRDLAGELFRGCSGVGTAFPPFCTSLKHGCDLTDVIVTMQNRTAKQKSAVKQEVPVWKLLCANAHFIRIIWCSLPFCLVWERRSHTSF